MNTLDWRNVGALVAIGAGVYLYTKHEATKAAQAVGTAVNPTSRDNLANRAVSGVGAAVSGDSNFSLGTWLWEALHPGQAATDNRIASGPATVPIRSPESGSSVPAYLLRQPGTSPDLVPGVYGGIQ